MSWSDLVIRSLTHRSGEADNHKHAKTIMRLIEHGQHGRYSRSLPTKAITDTGIPYGINMCVDPAVTGHLER